MNLQQQHDMVVKTIFELEEIGKYEEAKSLLLSFLENYQHNKLQEDFKESYNTLNYLMQEWHGQQI